MAYVPDAGICTNCMPDGTSITIDNVDTVGETIGIFTVEWCPEDCGKNFDGSRESCTSTAGCIYAPEVPPVNESCVPALELG
eukprot:COSAG02_NODE_31516_length_532_cov_0.939954_1_plen_81_part_01